jgi:uncharacterized protein YbjT (DUF2867 family)
MFAITGITGQVGGVVGRTLLADGKRIRAVLRDVSKGATWAAEGAEVALAMMDDAPALARAFAGAEGVFILLPPVFDPSPGFTESQRVIGAVVEALEAARPERIVCLSTIGAHSPTQNLLTQLSLLEQALGMISVPVTFLRAAWFMENAAWDVAPARETGVVRSFLQPLDRAIPMVATTDVGHAAARLLQERWAGRRVVELEGPERVSPNDVAAALARALQRPVVAEAIRRDRWEALFREQGMLHPLPRIRMLDGFNEGWIAFEGEPLRGAEGLDEVIARLVTCPRSPSQ